MVRWHQTPRTPRQRRFDAAVEVVNALGIDFDRARDARATASEWKRCSDAMNEAAEAQGLPVPTWRIVEGGTCVAVKLRRSKSWVGVGITEIHQLSHDQLVSVLGHELGHLRPTVGARMRVLGKRAIAVASAAGTAVGVPAYVGALVPSLPLAVGIVAGAMLAPVVMATADVVARSSIVPGQREETHADRLSARATGARNLQSALVFGLQRHIYMCDLRADIEDALGPAQTPAAPTRLSRMLDVLRHPIKAIICEYAKWSPADHPTDAERIVQVEDLARAQGAAIAPDVEWFLHPARRQMIESGTEHEVDVIAQYADHVRSLRPTPRSYSAARESQGTQTPDAASGVWAL